MKQLFYETQRDASLESVTQLRKLLEDIIKNIVSPESLRWKILLCFSEVATNLIEHSSSNVTYIGIRFSRSDGFWCLEIFDNGASWDPTKVPLSTDISIFTEDENGRGLSIIHHQSDEINYSIDSNCNTLSIKWLIPEKNSQPHILLVDDDLSISRLYSHYLNEQFKVTIASSGKEALKQLKDNQIDLVISDIHMPQMDGVSLRKQIMQDAKHQLIPFIFITGSKNNNLLDETSEIGIDDYLQKPVIKEKLLQTVQRVLKRSQQVNQTLTKRLDKSITSSLTPSLPKHSHGWKFALDTRHTGHGGGDVIISRTNTDNFHLVLTDIMGHDESAKFFGHTCAGFLHGLLHAFIQSDDPSYILERLSQYAFEDKILSQITMTCCSAVFANDGKVAFSCAGHPAPILISNNNIETIDSTGLLPGLLENTEYQSSQYYLESDQRLVMYTDGLFESAADNESRKRLETSIKETLLSTLNLPIDEALRSTMKQFDKLTNSLPTDDTLLLIIERD